MLKADYHTHTTFCDGTDTPEEIVRYAVSLGINRLGFSGHMDPDIHMDWSAYVSEITRLQEKYAGQIDILLGVELDTVYPPSSICDTDGRTRAEYIIGSTHFLGDGEMTAFPIDLDIPRMAQLCREFYGNDFYRLSRAYYELEAQVYDRQKCTFVGHFDLITRFNDETHWLDESSLAYRKPATEAMEYLVSRGVPFEINCGAVNRGRKKEVYPHPVLLRTLHELGGEILINSDAHRKELLTGGFAQAVRTALVCGFTHTNLLEHDSRRNVCFRQVPLDTL